MNDDKGKLGANPNDLVPIVDCSRCPERVWYDTQGYAHYCKYRDVKPYGVK